MTYPWAKTFDTAVGQLLICKATEGETHCLRLFGQPVSDYQQPAGTLPFPSREERDEAFRSLSQDRAETYARTIVLMSHTPEKAEA